MDIASATQTTNTQSPAPKASLADDFDTFLLLLTTQLQNQDPTSPMDTNQFTQQLVDFAGVEQQLKSNTHLEDLVNIALASSTNSVIGYLGQEVTVGGNTAELEKGKASWRYTLNGDADATTLTIKNAADETVLSTSGQKSQGSYSFDWNGRDQEGRPLKDGTYTLSVSAKDAAGNTIGASTALTGIVESIELDGASPVLNVGGTRVSPEEIRLIRTPTPKPIEAES